MLSVGLTDRQPGRTKESDLQVDLNGLLLGRLRLVRASVRWRVLVGSVRQLGTDLTAEQWDKQRVEQGPRCGLSISDIVLMIDWRLVTNR
jgi:membrane protein required for beta-lactamase induction